jgi:hypothetical protein
MGILDEAIREHLELKRAHGAGDSELKQLEDEAFGQAERPGDEEGAHDPLAEAPTEFMTQPETAEEPASRSEPPTIADLQEPPPPPAEEPLAVEEAGSDEKGTADESPSEEEQPAMEHGIVADLPPDEPEAGAEPEPEIEPSGPSTEERHAIAEQPTEIFDVEEELVGPPNPTDEELIEEEITEPRLAPTDPLAGLDEVEGAEVSVEGPAPDDDDEYDDEDDAFWNEQRLSDELDQALEAPRGAESTLADEPEVELEDEPEPVEDEPVEDDEPAAAETPRRDEDVLEETPDFLEETPEDDQLWFEQKPPKDFDFDD